MPFNNSINWKMMASVRETEKEEILHRGGSVEVESWSALIF
jgi:hypothetical protein